MERLTKIAVIAWMCAALALETWLLSSGWPNLPLLTLTVAVATAILGRYWRHTVAPLLAVSYAFPAIARWWHGGVPYAPHEAIWIAALAGVIVPEAIRTPWRIPYSWRPALVTAALVVVVASPIVILREIDINPGLLTDMRGWSWGGAGWPSTVVTWILHMSLTLVAGILWFDWLFGARDLDFRRTIIAPLVLGSVVLAAASIYQLFDLTFLNETVFASLGRASGTMYDANVSGTIAALWIGGSFLWARERWPGQPLPGILLVIVNWLTVWATGSRTAFGAAVVSTVFIAVSLREERWILRRRVMVFAAVAILALVAVVGVAGATNPRTVGPLGRVWATLPSPSVASVRAFTAEMWNRNGYGSTATAMFRQVPWFGIGVGTYHTIAADYVPGGLPPDNAQNWIRHQLVEFGIVGSLGWLVWFAVFGAFVMRARRRDSTGTWITRGVLIAFALISMLGMPGQDVMVAITFWTMAFWHVSESGRSLSDRPLPGWMWAAVLAVVVVAGIGTARLATTQMRMPVRALTATWPYSYGLSAPELSGNDSGYRQARAHAVAVVDVPYRWLTVSVRLATPVEQPVDVRVWTNGMTLLKGQLSSTVPLTAIVELPMSQPRLLLEAEARRVQSWRPFFLRESSPQFLMKWEFLDREPPGFNGYSRPFSS